MENFVCDKNAQERISHLEKNIKNLEKKAKNQTLSEDEIKILSDYKMELFSLKLKDSVIKK